MVKKWIASTETFTELRPVDRKLDRCRISNLSTLFLLFFARPSLFNIAVHLLLTTDVPNFSLSHFIQQSTSELPVGLCINTVKCPQYIQDHLQNSTNCSLVRKLSIFQTSCKSTYDFFELSY